MTFRYLLFSLSLLLAMGCSPKTTEPITEAESEPETPAEPQAEEGCRTFNQTPFRDEATDNYVLYRDQISFGDYEAAFPMWKFVFEKAPDADGKRNTVYTDGVKIYAHFFEQAETDVAKKAIIDTIMGLYDASLSCYGKTPEDRARVQGMKAFDYYYKFSEYTTLEKTYDLFVSAFDTLGQEAPAFLFNPFTALMVDRFLAEEISREEAQRWAAYLPELIEAKKAELDETTWRQEGWDIVEGYVPNRLESLEGVDDFFDCQYFRDKYLPEYEANPDDCETMRTVYGRLRWGNCDPNDPVLQEMWSRMIAQECIEVQQGTSASAEGKKCMQEGRYKCAVEKFEQAAEETEDPERKASYYMLIAKIYYSGLKRYASARKFAYKAAEYKKNWGEPYLLIGKLYASSGPLCGPGRGWASQVVTWPAIDKWQYARSIDPEARAEANRLINYYAQFMPSREDIFQRTLKEGDTFYVGCWIQERTTIRAAK